jgi:hypothetical protein
MVVREYAAALSLFVLCTGVLRDLEQAPEGMTAVDWPTDGASLLPLAAMPVPYELVIGRCSVEHVAERLGCDRGTSHQRRAASSVTFCDIVGTQCGIRGSP